MELVMLGLGRMGANMALRLARGGHTVYGWDRASEAITRAAKDGIRPLDSLDAIAGLAAPRTVWTMVPAGAPTGELIAEVARRLAKGDTVIDGANSNYKDSVARARDLAARGIALLDCGTSGGVWGLEEGYCLMVGGDEAAFRRAEPVFRTLAAENGYARVGAAGAGHFAKMIHNGIEYGLMQAYAEGFEILRAADYGYDLAALAELWGRGAVIRSWLLELAARALKKDPQLAKLEDYVEDSGMGRWTVAEAIERNIPAPVLTDALLARLRSRQEVSFGAKLLAALRAEFGGHPVKAAGKG
jgi:6-phosphogluconate dehydrogenase